MKYFTAQHLVSSVTRQLYVGNISSYTAIAMTVQCSLRPLSETEASNNGFQYGTAYNALFEPSADIRINDKITIETIEYTVKGVAHFNNGNFLDYKRALIVKPQS